MVLRNPQRTRTERSCHGPPLAVSPKSGLHPVSNHEPPCLPANYRAATWFAAITARKARKTHQAGCRGWSPFITATGDFAQNHSVMSVNAIFQQCAGEGPCRQESCIINRESTASGLLKTTGVAQAVIFQPRETRSTRHASTFWKPSLWIVPLALLGPCQQV
jgi:hypothetical protein